jgi:hypothetical protein
MNSHVELTINGTAYDTGHLVIDWQNHMHLAAQLAEWSNPGL